MASSEDESYSDVQGLRLSDSDSVDEQDRGSRPRWTKVWRTTAGIDALDSYRQSLPTHSIAKSDPTSCTIDHLFDKDYPLATAIHLMRVQLSKCRSRRCNSGPHDDDSDIGDNVACPCRYKFKICLSSGTCEVFQHNDHLADIDGSSSPVEQNLTPIMKEYIVEQLSSGIKTTAARLFAVICSMVHEGDMSGPPPKDQQVVDFVKNWRRKNPKNSMAPMIAICDGHIYDQQNLAALADTTMVILCDTQPAAQPGSTAVVSRLGDGSEAYPFRVGMTCLRQIREYVDIQNRSDTTTIFHLDSTHGLAIYGYSVFAFGYSDQSCHFIPMAYFCTSQKTKLDVGWCIRYMERVCMDIFQVHFPPQYVMMDADKAQFNACVTELAHSTVLMCWFHVTQNVWKHARAKRVSSKDTSSVFEDLYDMHYAQRGEFETIKERVLAKWRGLQQASAVQKLTQHIIKQWIDTPRFAKWQAFHTPTGYASTNNPLEQYHRRLKLECPDGPQSPDELIKGLDRARIAFLHRNISFCNFSTASDRLILLYRLLARRGCIDVERLPGIGSLQADLYRVLQRPLELTAKEKKSLKQSVKSANGRRKQLEGMPVSGWIVDTRSKICPCLYFKKDGACCHVIAACIRAGVHFPGVRNDSREFVHPRRGAGRMHVNRVVEVGNDRNDSARADTRLTTNDLGDSSPDEIETDDQSEPQSTENDGGDTGSDEDATNGTIATGLYNDHHLDAVSSQGSNNELDRDLPHPEIGAHPDSMAPDTELRVIANEVRDQTSQVVSNAHVAHSIQISAPQEAVPNADELQSAVDTQSIELQGTNADSSNGDYIDHSQVRRSCRAPKPTKRAIESRLQSGKRPRKKSG